MGNTGSAAKTAGEAVRQYPKTASKVTPLTSPQVVKKALSPLITAQPTGTFRVPQSSKPSTTFSSTTLPPSSTTQWEENAEAGHTQHMAAPTQPATIQAEHMAKMMKELGGVTSTNKRMDQHDVFDRSGSVSSLRPMPQRKNSGELSQLRSGSEVFGRLTAQQIKGLFVSTATEAEFARKMGIPETVAKNILDNFKYTEVAASDATTRMR